MPQAHPDALKKEAKPVFDLDSVQLVQIAAELQEGRDMDGNALMHPPDMFIGAVVNPNFQPLELQLLKMRKKAEAGAEFFQTQAVYNDATVDAFVENTARFGRPIQLGVVVLKFPQMGAYMNRNVGKGAGGILKSNFSACRRACLVIGFVLQYG